MSPHCTRRRRTRSRIRRRRRTRSRSGSGSGTRPALLSRLSLTLPRPLPRHGQRPQLGARPVQARHGISPAPLHNAARFMLAPCQACSDSPLPALPIRPCTTPHLVFAISLGSCPSHLHSSPSVLSDMTVGTLRGRPWGAPSTLCPPCRSARQIVIAATKRARRPLSLRYVMT
jgi:hypothetical protein